MVRYVDYLTYEVHAVTSGDGLVMIWFTSSGTHIGSEFPQLDGGDPPGERPRRQV